MRMGATTQAAPQVTQNLIVALRNENGSYNRNQLVVDYEHIVALRNENGSYNAGVPLRRPVLIVALRNENGSYNYRR